MTEMTMKSGATAYDDSHGMEITPQKAVIIVTIVITQ